jgi:hypothetical protein
MPLWLGVKEVVKRSGRDEPLWVGMCIEAMLGISLYSYLYLKLAKMLCLSYYPFNKIRKQEGKRGSTWKCGDKTEYHDTNAAISSLIFIMCVFVSYDLF